MCYREQDELLDMVSELMPKSIRIIQEEVLTCTALVFVPFRCNKEALEEYNDFIWLLSEINQFDAIDDVIFDVSNLCKIIDNNRGVLDGING